MDNSYRYQTEAIVSTEANISNGAISHRKITFNVVPEITNQNTEIWSMTLNPITSYQWSNLFTLYSNNQERFQIEVINNGAK